MNKEINQPKLLGVLSNAVGVFNYAFMGRVIFLQKFYTLNK